MTFNHENFLSEKNKIESRALEIALIIQSIVPNDVIPLCKENMDSSQFEEEGILLTCSEKLWGGGYDEYDCDSCFIPYLYLNMPNDEIIKIVTVEKVKEDEEQVKIKKRNLDYALKIKEEKELEQFRLLKLKYQ